MPDTATILTDLLAALQARELERAAHLTLRLELRDSAMGRVVREALVRG